MQGEYKNPPIEFNYWLLSIWQQQQKVYWSSLEEPKCTLCQKGSSFTHKTHITKAGKPIKAAWQPQSEG